VLAPGEVDNDGSKLQFLAQFQPYPYGLSPIALGFNYHKRAQLLQRIGQQKHVQMSSLVIDHQPALSLEAWGAEEWDRARQLEQRGLPAVANAENLTRELRTSTIAPDSQIVDRASIDQAVFSYRMATQVYVAAVPEMESHIAHFPSNMQNFSSHLATVRAGQHLMRADGAYLQAMIAAPAQREGLLATAKAEYQEASKWYHVLILKYYIDPPDAAVIKYQRNDISDKMTLPELTAILARARAHLKQKYKDPLSNPAIQDLREYDEEIHRIDDRISLIK